MATSNPRQPFLAHVEELRYRLTWSVISLVAASALGYYLRDYLLQFLVEPLGLPLYYTSPGGGFNLIIQLCLGFGLALSVPVFIFHIIRFTAPVIPAYTFRLLIKILLSSTFLVILGVAFAYYVSLPAALYFLSEFSTDQVKALISTDTYISFVSIYLAGFAILFQLPLLLLLINRINPLQPRQLLKQFRWVVLAAAVIAAILTPTPDPFNQMIMATPVVGLYGLSIGMVGVMNRSKKPVAASRTVEELLLDLSNKKLIAKHSAAHRGRMGYVCTWEEKSWEGSERTIVTFLHNGKHELIAIEEAQKADEIMVPALF